MKHTQQIVWIQGFATGIIISLSATPSVKQFLLRACRDSVVAAKKFHKKQWEWQPQYGNLFLTQKNQTKPDANP